MNPSYKPKICFTFKEYESKFDSLRQNYLNEYEDYGEIYFIEREIEFYSMCYESSCITSIDNGDGEKKYVINKGGTSDGLVEEIYKNLLISNKPDNWDFELSVKYKATFRRIINFLENKKREYFDAKNSMEILNYPPIPTIVVDKPENSVNPHPRIFTSYKAFLIFEKLNIVFGNTKNNLADYSFVYHKMVKDNLIFSSIRNLEFINFLATFEIYIDRIKDYKSIGKKKLRESIYASAK